MVPAGGAIHEMVYEDPQPQGDRRAPASKEAPKESISLA
jgi:hypothetical protein